jgi:uncharacterized protein (TIGR00730 family)
VYAASSDAVDADYLAVAERLGALLAGAGKTLVYGGGNVGLMGACARAVHAGGGRVVGVIPEKLQGLELGYEAADEYIVTTGMRERKAIMEERADAFVALPGGLGTLEEIIEVLVLKQLQYHDKPLVFLNTRGVFDPLFAFFDRLVADRFLKAGHRALFHVVDAPEAVLPLLAAYTPPPREGKWFA